MTVSSDRRFLIVFAVVLGVLVTLALVLIVLASLTTRGIEDHPRLRSARLSQRLAPLAEAATAAAAPSQPAATAGPSAGGAPALSGQQVVQQVCSACHGAGLLGSPKIGDHANWAARFKAAGGLDGLVKVALQGKGNMPPKGGNSALTQDEIKGAIQYMLSHSQVSP